MCNWITKSRRLGIYIRDGFQCAYCGRDLKNAAVADVTLDHLVPRNPLVSHGGGGNENTNLITACRSCNSSRQDKPWASYATGGARDRIETLRYQAVNEKLSKAILDGSIAQAVADVEELR
jgi:5-methylcytosine-specific restriction endonuclease McrA